MTKQYIHAVIAENSPIILEGLKVILERSGMCGKLQTANTANELLLTAQRQSPDVIIMNPAILQENRDLIEELRKIHPEIKIIGLIYTYFEPRLLASFDLQLPIHFQPAEIIAGLQQLLSRKSDNDPQPRQVLSEREIDVLKLLVTGASNKEIAEKLFISIHTVISHRKNISVKTGIKSVSGLTIYAVVKNLVNLENFS